VTHRCTEQPILGTLLLPHRVGAGDPVVLQLTPRFFLSMDAAAIVGLLQNSSTVVGISAFRLVNAVCVFWRQ